MLDTPTSLVRSAPVGHPELVGQVRPWAAGTMTVYVDSNQSMVMHHMVGYWTYEQYKSGRSKTTKETRRDRVQLGHHSHGQRRHAVHSPRRYGRHQSQP